MFPLVAYIYLKYVHSYHSLCRTISSYNPFSYVLLHHTPNRSDLNEERQQKRQKVLEQFFREAKRRGELTVIYENKIREDFRRKQEAEEQKLQEDEKRRQILLDEALAKELLDKEEWKHKRQMGCVMEKTDTQERLRQVEKEKKLAEEFEKM